MLIIRIKYILLTFLLNCSLCSCSQNVGSYDELLNGMYKNTVPLIHSQQLSDKLKNSNSIVILDTREKKEYEISHIKNAVWVGYNDFKMKRIASISHLDTIVVYCSVGYRSERIGERLKKNGYSNVFNLYGGIFEWMNNIYPVYDKDDKPTIRVHVYSKEWGKWLKDGEKVYE